MDSDVKFYSDALVTVARPLYMLHDQYYQRALDVSPNRAKSVGIFIHFMHTQAPSPYTKSKLGGMPNMYMYM